MSEVSRRLLVLVVAGPITLIVGTFWFVIAMPIAVLMAAMNPHKEWWLWKYVWSFATLPFFGFWCLLTGYVPPESEFWR